MRKSKILAAVLSVFGALTLVLAACAPATTPTPTATPTPPPVVATPTPGVATPTPVLGVATPTPAPVVATPTLVAGMPVGYGYSPFGEWGMPLNLPPPQYGGTYREARSMLTPHFDSHRTYGQEVTGPMGLVFDNLIRYSPYMDVDIMPDTYRVEYLAPNLAEKWEVSQDGLAVTFYLKKGVKWHDGKPFTAKDVKYSFDKLMDAQRSVFTADLAMVDRVETVDDYTVKFFLKYPATRLFLLIMGMNQLTIQPEHLKAVSYQSTDFVVGTGPFKLKSYTSHVEFVYEKNPDYHFKGRPYFDGVKYPIFGSSIAAVETLIAGQVDYFENPGGEEDVVLAQRVAPEVKVRFNNKLGAVTSIFISFLKEWPGQDVRVRKAMTMVVDRGAACVASYGGIAGKRCNPKGGYFISEPAGRGLLWSEYEKAWLQDRPMADRVTEAKRLLAEAGYPDGFKATFTSPTAVPPWVLSVLDYWKRLLSIDLKLDIIPTARWLPVRNEGAFETIQAGTVAFVGAMEQLVSSNYIKGGLSNYGRYYHPLVEELYVKLLKERDPNEALKTFHQIERILIDDVPIIPAYVWNQMFMEWPYIKPKMFAHPVWHSSYNGRLTVTWLDKNDPTYAKRAK